MTKNDVAKTLWPLLRFAACLMVLSTTIISPSAFAWEGKAHKYIGSEGFHQACVQLFDQYTKNADQSERFNLICKVIRGDVTSSRYKGAFTYESLMGEWSRLAADHTDRPQQLTAIKLQDMVVDVGVSARIAVTNYKHFQPASAISWRDDHAHALDEVLTASKAKGLDRIRRLEDALAVESFAQHYLQTHSPPVISDSIVWHRVTLRH